MSGLAQFGLFVLGEVSEAAHEAGSIREPGLEVRPPPCSRGDPDQPGPQAATPWRSRAQEEVFEERLAMLADSGFQPDEAEFLARREVARVLRLPWEEPLFPEELYQRHGFAVKAAPGAVAKVEAIATQALALGWTEEGLFSTRGALRFPSLHYGLVCYLHPGERIAEITAEFARIRAADGRLSRVPNPALRPGLGSQALRPLSLGPPSIGPPSIGPPSTGPPRPPR